MFSVKEFKKKNPKKQREIILNAEFDATAYTALNELPGADRKKIAAELMAEMDKSGIKPTELINKLSNLCFDNNGPAFIRYGAGDFLADILQVLVKQLDGAAFVTAAKLAWEQAGKPAQCAFPEHYKFNPSLQYYFNQIHSTAIKWARTKNESQYVAYLGQNFANKLFFPLLVDHGTPAEGAILVTPFKKWAADEKSVEAYFSSRLPRVTLFVEQEHTATPIATPQDPVSEKEPVDEIATTPATPIVLISANDTEIDVPLTEIAAIPSIAPLMPLDPLDISVTTNPTQPVSLDEVVTEIPTVIVQKKDLPEHNTQTTPVTAIKEDKKKEEFTTTAETQPDIVTVPIADLSPKPLEKVQQPEAVVSEPTKKSAVESRQALFEAQPPVTHTNHSVKAEVVVAAKANGASKPEKVDHVVLPEAVKEVAPTPVITVKEDEKTPAPVVQEQNKREQLDDTPPLTASKKQVSIAPKPVPHSVKTNPPTIVSTPMQSKNEPDYNASIHAIGEVIKTRPWILGGFLFFQGGVTVEFEGKSMRVPHRVAAIVELIKNHDETSDKGRAVYNAIVEKAQQGFDAPRSGQHETTKAFYSDVILGIYLQSEMSPSSRIDKIS